MVRVRIGNQEYDAVYQAACNTCRHPARMLIEEKILQNFSFRAISELFSETSIKGEGDDEIVLPRISHQSVYNHFHNGHMPLEAATLRRLAQRRAEQIGSQYEERAEQFVDHYVLSQAVVHKTYNRLVNGEIQPEVKDGLAAAKMIAEVEAQTQAGLDSEAWSQAMQVYFETAQRFMDPASWAAFSQSLATNPILRAIQARLSPESEDNVIDADVVAIEGAKRG